MSLTLTLPKDLKEAELMLYQQLDLTISEGRFARISANLVFEGLRLMPIAIRLAEYLFKKNQSFLFVWPDAGATALAKRDCPDLSKLIFSLSEVNSNDSLLANNQIILVVGPQQFDYDDFHNLSDNFQGTIVMLNGKLEDFAVGIGSVARQRRKNFLSQWNNIFWLQPLNEGALMNTYKEGWQLYKSYIDGYRFLSNFTKKPLSEEINDALINSDK